MINVGILFVASYAAMNGIVAKFYVHKFESVFELMPLIIIPVMSRACSALAVLEYPTIAESQYAKSFEAQVSYRYRLFINAFWIIPIVVMEYLEPELLKVYMVLVIVPLVHFVVTAYARKQLGGMNGDIAGYALTISECVGLLAWNFVI